MASPALTLAVVDDHNLMRPGLALTVGGWPHARQVVQAENGVHFERVTAEVGHIHIAIIDRETPRRDGFYTLPWMAHHHPAGPISEAQAPSRRASAPMMPRHSAAAFFKNAISKGSSRPGCSAEHRAAFRAESYEARGLLPSVGGECTGRCAHRAADG
jgi:DNA-binding NarL/FixJ family response regulator